LFKYLLCARNHTAPKEEIAETLWPDDPNGFKNLHAAAHDVRTWLKAAGHLVYSSSEYSLDSFAIDADDFERTVQYGRARWPTNPAAGRQAYEAAVLTYGGPFLPDELYAGWVVTRRERLEARFIEAALKVARCFLDECDPEPALELAIRVSEIDEGIEDAVRLEMEALARLGRRSQALRRYEKLKLFLNRELHCRPDAATETVRSRVLGQ
jgi:DNA-binding SARP family transcriptional activator